MSDTDRKPDAELPDSEREVTRTADSLVEEGASACRCWIESRANWPLKDQYRVGAECTYIEEHLKAQGTADFKGQTDSHTQWFTEHNKVFYSEWRTKNFFAPTARMDFEPR